MSISKKGNRWRIALYVGQYPDGRSRYEYRYARTEAEAKRTERQELKDREELYGQGTSNQKLRLFLQDWLETVRAHQAKRTYVSYEAVMRLRVLPTSLAELPLNKITPAAVQQWVNGLADDRAWVPKSHKQAALSNRSISKRTQHRCYTVLHTALQVAVEQGLLVRNPTDHVKHAKREERAPTVWVPADEVRFIAACLEDGHRCCQLLVLKAYTGARVGDLLNAEEAQCNLENRVLMVLQGKTDTARRPIPLVPEAVSLLQTVKTEQDQERDDGYWDEEAKQENWLFRGPKGHQLHEEKVVYHFHRIRRKLGLDYSRPHDLRHAFATNALRAGVDRKIVGRALGHANENMTGYYQHVDVPMLHIAAELATAPLRLAKTEPCPHCGGTGRVPMGSHDLNPAPVATVGSGESNGRSPLP